MAQHHKLANCTLCGVLFQKSLSLLCPECKAKEQEKFQKLYRTLQSSSSQGGIYIEDLAKMMDMAVDEIDSLFFQGHLGTAGMFLKTKCILCGDIIGSLKRRGRYCVPCSEKAANKAGVSVHDRKQVLNQQEKDAEKERLVRELNERKKAKQEGHGGGAGGRRFGLTRNSKPT